MTALQSKNMLPMGLAWNWVKYCFATFREKPVNFLLFAVMYIASALLPIVGAFVAVLMLARIYFSIDKVERGQILTMKLDFLALLRQRNITSYALVTLLFDAVMMAGFSFIIHGLALEVDNPLVLADPHVMYLLVGINLLRAAFFGIALPILTFNPELELIKALTLSWRFLYHNMLVISCSLLLLLPFLMVPLYLTTMVVMTVNNMLLLGLAGLSLVLEVLLFIIIMTIFSYKLYQDGIINAG